MKIEQILKACFCAFGQNTFDLLLLEEEVFIMALKDFLQEKNLRETISDYAYEFDYDYENIMYSAQKFERRDEDFDYDEVINNCRKAYIKTIFEDKTLNAEALIDNVVEEFNKN